MRYDTIADMRSTAQIVPVASKKSGKHRRKHRRVRSDWSGCECPDGSEYRSTPRITRGWTCIKKTARGPRFVRAVCDTSTKRLPASTRNESNTKYLTSERKLLPASTLFGVRSDKTSSSAKRREKTGAACGCPEGAKRIKTKQGSRCHKNGKFVKTACVTGG